MEIRDSSLSLVFFILCICKMDTVVGDNILSTLLQRCVIHFKCSVMVKTIDI